MTFSASYAHFTRLQEDSPELKALRTHHLPFMAAVLSEFFPTAQSRITEPELQEKLAGVLTELRATGQAGRFDDENVTPGQLCRTWLQAKVLARRQDPKTRQEYFELTSTGQNVLAFLSNLERPHTATTRSRLAMLAEQLAELERSTNPDKEARIASLKRARDEIDARIALVESGTDLGIDELQATEMVQDIATLARAVPQDFSRVREHFSQLAAELRKSLLDSNDPQETTLDNLFTQLDLVRSSDAGRSFEAFFSLVNDYPTRELFTSAVEALEERGVLAALHPADREMLHSYIYTLVEESMPVQRNMRALSQNLRDFVRSRRFQEFRALSDRLQAVQSLGLRASEYVKPFHEMPLELQATASSSYSVGRLKLSVPASEIISEEVHEGTVDTIDLDTLQQQVRESEIDFAQLRHHINGALADGPATVGEVLEKFPAEQGLASVVGLLALAMQHGNEVVGQQERVEWTGMFDGVTRAATISCYRFEGRVDE